MIPASEFDFDPVAKTCICPAGESMWIRREGNDDNGNPKIFFEGRLSKCRDCSFKRKCMQNPDSANTRKGHGRQVSFILEDKRKPNYTDWMKHRVDSDNGPEFISHEFTQWAVRHGIRIEYIQPGKPQQNAYIERTNRTIRYSWVSKHLFETLEQVQEYATEWLWFYNNERPHKGNNGRPPLMVA